MSSHNQILVVTKLPIQDGFIFSPLTGRKISVSGRIYKSLVNKNILKINPEDSGSMIYQGNTDLECKDVNKKLKVVDENHTTLVKNNKIFKRRKTVNKAELQKKVQQVALEVYKENSSLFTDGMPEDQVQNLLQNLIQQKLANPEAHTSTSSKLKSNFEYIVEHLPSEEDESSDYDSEEEDEDEDE
jgi:hypothetical protein